MVLLQQQFRPCKFHRFHLYHIHPKGPKDHYIQDAEKGTILNWLAKDAQTKALIDHKISPVIANLLNNLQTARQQWELLSQHYSCNNLLSQYELHIRVHSEKLKDADDATWFISVFEDAHHRFIQMGVVYSTEELVFNLLQGLLSRVEWEVFWEFMLSKLSASSSPLTSTTSPTTTFTFEDAAKLLMEKANSIVGRQRLVAPGSKYANTAIGEKGGDFFLGNKQRTLTRMLSRQLLLPPWIEH